MIIKNASVYTPNFIFENKDVYIDGEFIAETACEKESIDGSGCYLIPGLIDIHFHGCAGYDFCDATSEALTHIGAYEIRNGITSICPASMTLSESRLMEICQNAVSYRNNWIPGKTASLCGINLEGPFISAKKKGAQNPVYIQTPDIDMFERLLATADGLIKLTTIAPETENALAFIRHFANKVRISVGHTDCDYGVAHEAFMAGALHMTHLYNAMPALSHRNPGPIAAGMDSADVTAEIICDGIHIDPAAVRAAFALFGAERIIFISDSMMATGMPDGDYALGGLDVLVKGNLATLKDGTLAGSATNLMKCLQTAVWQMQIPLETAIRCATANPAKAIGVYDRIGSIETGKYADLVLLDKKTLEPVKIFSHGIEILQ
ncbi:MAG: N-acetylglucosamine-6-phosphate deacetylase [Lachnospiraceae bacterium]|nr:N-acetylglucosamine-6-phosphate deacetylase [Lachnospiraceae bacterium]